MSRDIEKLLIDTHLWVAAAAGSLVIFVTHALGLTWVAGPAVLVAASTLLIYRIDGWADGDRPTDGTLPTLLAAAALIWSWSQAPTQVRWLVGIGAVPCLLYGWRWRGPFTFCLRELPGIKPFFVTGALTVAIVGVPVLWSSTGAFFAQAASGSTSLATGLAAWLWLLLLLNVTLFDLRDRQADEARGLSTIPVIFGAAATRRGIAVAAILLSVLSLATSQLMFTLHIHIGLSLSFVATAICVRSLSAGSSRLRYAVWVDGIPVMLGLSVWITAP